MRLPDVAEGAAVPFAASPPAEEVVAHGHWTAGGDAGAGLLRCQRLLSCAAGGVEELTVVTPVAALRGEVELAHSHADPASANHPANTTDASTQAAAHGGTRGQMLCGDDAGVEEVALIALQTALRGEEEVAHARGGLTARV